MLLIFSYYPMHERELHKMNKERIDSKDSVMKHVHCMRNHKRVAIHVVNGVRSEHGRIAGCLYNFKP